MSHREYVLLCRLDAAGGSIDAAKLSNREGKLLDVLCARGFARLSGHGSDAEYILKPAGRVAIENYRVLRFARRAENIRYAITTAIAILALLVAIASFMQSTGRIDISRWPPRLLPQESTRDGATVRTHMPTSRPSC